MILKIENIKCLIDNKNVIGINFQGKLLKDTRKLNNRVKL